MDEVTIFAGTGQYNCSQLNAKILEAQGIAYFCGEKLKDCPFVSDPKQPENICPFWHFTAAFADKFNQYGDNDDEFPMMADECDQILGIDTTR